AMPAVRVRGADLPGGDEALAQIGAAVQRVQQRPAGEPLEQRIGEQDTHREAPLQDPTRPCASSPGSLHSLPRRALVKDKQPDALRLTEEPRISLDTHGP